eukprot:6428957-Pyramimonas_sp.AAC.1
MEYYEDARIVAGLSKQELTGRLPLKGRRTICSMRVLLHCNPDYVPATRVRGADPDPRHGAQWLKKSPSSTSPDMHPSRLFNTSHAERREAVEQFRIER